MLCIYPHQVNYCPHMWVEGHSNRGDHSATHHIGHSSIIPVFPSCKTMHKQQFQFVSFLVSNPPQGTGVTALSAELFFIKISPIRSLLYS